MTQPDPEFSTESPAVQPDSAPDTFDLADPAPRSRAERAALHGQVATGVAPEPPRRGFFRKVLATAVGAVIVAVPTAAGLLVFLDPVRRARRSAGRAETGSADFVPVAPG